MKNKKCYTCKHAGQKFKIAGKTHLHCRNPVKYPELQEAVLPWETLRFFADSCKLHEQKSTT